MCCVRSLKICYVLRQLFISSGDRLFFVKQDQYIYKEDSVAFICVALFLSLEELQIVDPNQWAQNQFISLNLAVYNELIFARNLRTFLGILFLFLKLLFYFNSSYQILKEHYRILLQFLLFIPFCEGYAQVTYT